METQYTPKVRLRVSDLTYREGYVLVSKRQFYVEKIDECGNDAVMLMVYAKGWLEVEIPTSFAIYNYVKHHLKDIYINISEDNNDHPHIDEHEINKVFSQLNKFCVENCQTSVVPKDLIYSDGKIIFSITIINNEKSKKKIKYKYTRKSENSKKEYEKIKRLVDFEAYSQIDINLMIYKDPQTLSKVSVFEFTEDSKTSCSSLSVLFDFDEEKILSYCSVTEEDNILEMLEERLSFEFININALHFEDGIVSYKNSFLNWKSSKETYNQYKPFVNLIIPVKREGDNLIINHRNTNKIENLFYGNIFVVKSINDLTFHDGKITIKYGKSKKVKTLVTDLSHKDYERIRQYVEYFSINLLVRIVNDKFEIVNYDEFIRIISVFSSYVETIPWENIIFGNNFYTIKSSNKQIESLNRANYNCKESYNFIKSYFAENLPEIKVLIKKGKIVKLFNKPKFLDVILKLKEAKNEFDIISDSDINRSFSDSLNLNKIQLLKNPIFKSKYFDFLIEFQLNGYKIIPAVEAVVHESNFNSNLEEDAFIFTVMNFDTSLVKLVFENINENRSTLVFVIEKENYMDLSEKIYNFMRDVDFVNKRSKIRNSPLINEPGIRRIYSVNHTYVDEWKCRIVDKRSISLLSASSLLRRDDAVEEL